jgi:hypothetical protein
MKRALTLLALLATLAGCSTIPRYEAANDIHAFLVAIRDGDRATFDAHVDKPALKTNLKARLLEETRQHKDLLGGLGVMLGGPLIEVAVDAAAKPEVFRAVAAEYGYDAAKPIPNTLVIAQYVRPLDGDRACIVTRKKGPCVFLFKNEDGTWRLIDFQGHASLDKGKVKLSD